MRRFLPYLSTLRGRRTYLVLALLCGALGGLVYGGGLPLVLKQVFPRIFTEGERILPAVQVIGYALLIPAIFLVRATSGFFNIYARLQHLPLSYLGKNRTGDLLSRLTADTLVVQQTITITASDLVIQPITLLGAIGFLGYVATENAGVPVFLASLGVIPLCIFPVRFVGRKLLRRAAENQRLLGDIADVAHQNFAAAREVRAFGLEQREISLFEQTTRRLFRAQMKVVKYSHILSPTIEVIASLGIAVSLYYAYFSGLTLPVFVAILGALFAAYDPVKRLAALHAQFTRGAASLDRIEEILREPVLIADPPAPVAVERLQGRLTFEGVSFAYQPGEPVLHDVGIEIPAGTVCALVGPSGAGKTTFANLVPRFYDATAGTVRIDGHDVRSLRLADLRRNIALVGQEPVLFNDTIYANLLLGRAGATWADVEEAARHALADDFIGTLPQGYETIVGERGTALSGGQRQRIALARAFLRNAPILILDEATSALDSESEAAIQTALHRLVAGKTVLIIAHRFSTIRDASLILLFDAGRIVATGSHADLYARHPLYKSLYDRQATGG